MHTFQSLGFVPETITLMTTWDALGVGMGDSMISTRGPAWTMASFIVDVECYVMNGRLIEENCRLIQRVEDRRSSIIDIIHRLGSLTIQKGSHYPGRVPEPGPRSRPEIPH